MIKELGKKYIEVVNYSSSLSQGWLRKAGTIGPFSSLFSVTGMRAVRDVDENTSKGFLENYLVDPSNSASSLSESWHQISAIPLSASPKSVLYDISRSGRFHIGFYNNGIGTAGTKKDTGSFIELTDKERGNYRLDTSAIHGKVIGDGWFGGGCSWSSDEQYVVYVAQVIGSSSTSPSRKTVIEGLASNNNNNNIMITKEEEGKGTSNELLPNKFDYVEDWGEKYVDIAELGIFIFDLQQRRIISLPLNDVKEYTIGQPVFLPTSTEAGAFKYSIAYTAWNVKPRRLGMIYCYQRKSSVWVADITTILSNHETALPSEGIPFQKVSSGLEIARSPRGSPSGNYLIFLGNRKGFLSHGGCSELFKVDLHTLWQKTTKLHITTLIPEVRRANHNEIGFPGLFLDSLPKYCFVSDHDILCTSTWESREALIRISLIRLNEIEDIIWWKKHPYLNHWEDSSIQILDVSSDGYLLTQISNPASPPQLLLINLLEQFKTNVVLGPQSKSFAITSKYIPASEPSSLPSSSLSLFAPLRWEVFHHQTDGIPFNSIFLYSKASVPSTGCLPLIVVPHGGPHSCFTNSYVASYVFLAQVLQVGILLINFRGSTGFGQDSVESLLGTIGTNDVADIITAVERALTLTWDATAEDIREKGTYHDETLIRLIDEKRIGIVGGSHGGFLAAHLCGQFPHFFKACALRNPVTNLPAMASVTDIPDWCHVEAKSSASELGRGAITDEELIAMRKVSPIAYIEQYCTPTLICLGAKDRRVPASQGIEFYHLLQARSIPSRLMIFPEDVHAIDSPTAEAEHWIAIAAWIAQYL